MLAKNRIERALAEGATSEEWPRLHGLVLETVFSNLALIVGYAEQPHIRPHTWADLNAAFAAEAVRRIVLGKLRESTWTRCQHTLSEFTEFLSNRALSELAQLSRLVVDDFKTWRVVRIKQRRNSREARSLALDAAILHRVFSHGIELEMIVAIPCDLEVDRARHPSAVLAV